MVKPPGPSQSKREERYLPAVLPPLMCCRSSLLQVAEAAEHVGDDQHDNSPNHQLLARWLGLDRIGFRASSSRVSGLV
jgi:hypothetical protein